MKKEKLTKFSDYVYYYKWHVIIFIIVAVVMAFSIKSCSEKIPDDLAVSVLISNKAPVSAGENIEKDLIDGGVIPDVNGDGTVSAYVNIVTVPLEIEDEMDMAGSQQAMIAMAADDSVLILMDEDLLEIYMEQGGFADISSKAAEYGIPKDKLYADEAGDLIAISLADNQYLKSKGIVTDTLYACYRDTTYMKNTEENAAKIKAADDILKFILGK